MEEDYFSKYADQQGSDLESAHKRLRAYIPKYFFLEGLGSNLHKTQKSLLPHQPKTDSYIVLLRLLMCVSGLRNFRRELPRKQIMLLRNARCLVVLVKFRQKFKANIENS